MSTEQAFPWRKVVVSAFLPTILFSIGEGAIIPIIPNMNWAYNKKIKHGPSISKTWELDGWMFISRWWMES